jgi:hypothetical protein
VFINREIWGCITDSQDTTSRNASDTYQDFRRTCGLHVQGTNCGELHGVVLQDAVMSFVTALICSYLTLIISLPEIELRWLAILLHMQDVADSNLRLQSGLPDILSVFSTLQSSECQHNMPRVSSMCNGTYQEWLYAIWGCRYTPTTKKPLNKQTGSQTFAFVGYNKNLKKKT